MGWGKASWGNLGGFWRSGECVGRSLILRGDVLGGLADEDGLEDTWGVDGVDFGGDFELVADGYLEAFAPSKAAVPVEGEAVAEFGWHGFAGGCVFHGRMFPTVLRHRVFWSFGKAQAPWKVTAR